MTEEIQFYLSEAEESMQKAVQHTGAELTKIRAGKASPAMVEHLRVDYYGTLTPLTQVANVATPDARTILIKPWEKNMLGEINKSIKNSDRKLQKEGTSEDAVRDAEAKVQKMTDSYIVKIDELLTKKEAEIMTI